MAFLVANIPPVSCYVRKEFLYDFQKGHGEYIPCIWVSVKSIRGQAFRIEAYLTEYGAVYDKLPIHAFVSKIPNTQSKMIIDYLPLNYLQIWDCMSYDITVIRKPLLANLRCKFLAKNKKWYEGEYLFTVDEAAPDFNVIDTSYSEDAEQHKSFNFIKLDNGQFAAQPNNRVLFLDPSTNPEQLKHPDFHVCTKIYSVEKDAKWALGDTTTVMYEKTNGT